MEVSYLSVKARNSVALTVAGVMTGTSADGIDVVVARFAGVYPQLEWEVMGIYHTPLPQRVRELIDLGSQGEIRSREYAELEYLISSGIAKALREVFERTPFALVGIHGQTLWHSPGGEWPFTHQVLDPYRVAQELNLPVIWDFRRGDLAAGGEGAPLTPLAHLYLFYPKVGAGSGFLNLGGIANYTYLAGGDLSEVLAWDTGPGMALLDTASRKLLKIPYDPQGREAKKGRIVEEVVEELLCHPYLQRTPPKSTGKEEFGPGYLEEILKRYPDLHPPDLLATLAAFTARSVALGLNYAPLPRKLYVYGGGLKHQFLMQELRRALPGVDLVPLSQLGLHPQGMEALAFALLAYERWHGRPGNIPCVTGARNRVLLGSIVGATLVF